MVEHTCQAAANHWVSGVGVWSNTVPAVTDVSRRQAAHSHRPPERRQALLPPQPGQRNPSGHRSRSRYAAQAASSANQATNSDQVPG